MARRLDRFTLRTRDMSEAAHAARNALVTSVEPDELLFEALPAALGFPAIPAAAQECEGADSYARTVAAVFEELSVRANRLLSELLELLLETSAETTRLAVSGQAASLEGQGPGPRGAGLRPDARERCR